MFVRNRTWLELKLPVPSGTVMDVIEAYVLFNHFNEHSMISYTAKQIITQKGLFQMLGAY